MIIMLLWAEGKKSFGFEWAMKREREEGSSFLFFLTKEWSHLKNLLLQGIELKRIEENDEKEMKKKDDDVTEEEAVKSVWK